MDGIFDQEIVRTDPNLYTLVYEEPLSTQNVVISEWVKQVEKNLNR